MQYGLKIKLKRIEKGYTQKKLAQELSVTVSTIQNYEAEKREPKIETMKKLSKILGISVQDLFFSDEE
ncbi:helix-turn-helix domain protein [Clostridium sp. DL-VIII]|uniref:helix-turn-helix transcriptional regulator n=1 Tax=Clostridium sp. DL-VIII TaxID=641107 RepID=UPI00023AF0DD|nr:helix-turn-helix transcriptional regulator [Clostridium sp. DL-VIII]EHI96986.1 helix-turn-helix domain protein [Clostridium sp. DL-VIII]